MLEKCLIRTTTHVFFLLYDLRFRQTVYATALFKPNKQTAVPFGAAAFTHLWLLNACVCACPLWIEDIAEWREFSSFTSLYNSRIEYKAYGSRAVRLAVLYNQSCFIYCVRFAGQEFLVCHSRDVCQSLQCWFSTIAKSGISNPTVSQEPLYPEPLLNHRVKDTELFIWQLVCSQKTH